MELKNWEVWEAEEREIKILRDLTIKLCRTRRRNRR